MTLLEGLWKHREDKEISSSDVQRDFSVSLMQGTDQKVLHGSARYPVQWRIVVSCWLGSLCGGNYFYHPNSNLQLSGPDWKFFLRNYFHTYRLLCKFWAKTDTFNTCAQISNLKKYTQQNLWLSTVISSRSITLTTPTTRSPITCICPVVLWVVWRQVFLWWAVFDRSRQSACLSMSMCDFRLLCLWSGF